MIKKLTVCLAAVLLLALVSCIAICCDEGPHYDITEKERDLLATLVFLEAGSCSQNCKQAVISVVFNRLESNCWREDMNGDGAITLYDIVYYPQAFSPAYLIEEYIGSAPKDCYDAVDYIVKNGSTLPTYVRYFRASYHFDWDGYVGYGHIDNVYFGYLADWRKGAW